jgi:hypothetical protein
MAKKAVATLREKGTGRNTVKCIRMVRSGRSGAYAFQEELTAIEEAKDFFAGTKA